jgi:hypothetical protein
MSMYKGSAKHMSAESEKNFEEKLEGQDFGDLDDWGTQLGVEILGIEKKMANSNNAPVKALLERRLAVYNAALALIENNPKAAAIVGDGKGVKAIVKYIISKAQEQAAEAELAEYINLVKPLLPGVRLSEVAPASPLVRPGAAGGSSRAAGSGSGGGAVQG